MIDAPIPADSPEIPGGVIPGLDDAPAFALRESNPSAIPILIAVPHAGRSYPPALLAAMRNPELAWRMEDRLVDRLADRVASETGASVLRADAPRAMIDLNRATSDVDWTMIAGGIIRPGENVAPTSSRARSGLGLVPRRLPGIGEFWRGQLARADVEQRIALIHQPYHACLAGALGRIRERWGAALLLDLHSMPPLPETTSGGAAQFVLGDRFGASCRGSLIAAAFSTLARGRWLAAHNRPYAGGHALERHADPRRGLHGLQVEIDRTAYLDSRLREPGEGFDRVVTQLIELVTRLAQDVAALGADCPSGWAAAAE